MTAPGKQTEECALAVHPGDSDGPHHGGEESVLAPAPVTAAQMRQLSTQSHVRASVMPAN